MRRKNVGFDLYALNHNNHKKLLKEIILYYSIMWSNDLPFDNFLENEIMNTQEQDWKDRCVSLLSNRSSFKRSSPYDLKNKNYCSSNRHIFITVSLPTEVDLEEVVSFDFDKLKLEAKEAVWVFEFYGKDLKYHPHLHMLVNIPKMKLDKQRIIKRISKLFNVKTNFVDYRYGNSHHLYLKRFTYLTGKKTDKKKEQVLADEKFRLKHNISRSYAYIP